MPNKEDKDFVAVGVDPRSNKTNSEPKEDKGFVAVGVDPRKKKEQTEISPEQEPSSQEEQTSSRDFSSLSEAMGERFKDTGNTQKTTIDNLASSERIDKYKEAQALEAKKKAKLKRLETLAAENVEFFLDSDARETFRKRLLEKGEFNSQEIDQAITMAHEIAFKQEEKENTNKAETYLKYVSGYGKDASIKAIGLATDDQIEDWTNDMTSKGISLDGVENALANYQSLYIGLKGKDKEAENKSKIEIALKSAESNTQREWNQEEKSEYRSELLEQQFLTLLPSGLQQSAASQKKIAELNNYLKEENISAAEIQKTQLKISALEKVREESESTETLYDNATGQFDRKEDIDKYANMVISFEKQLTDKEKTAANVEKAMYRYESMDQEYNQKFKVKSYDGTIQEVTAKEAVYLPDMMIEGLTPTDHFLFKRASATKSNWMKSKAQFDAINRAYLTNTDPSSVEKSFLGTAVQSATEAFGFGQLTTGTDKKFIEEFATIMDDLGSSGLLTDKQREAAEESMSQQVAGGIGSSLPIMAEIIASSIATEGIGGALKIAKHLKPLKTFLTKKWGKIGTFTYNLAVEGTKGAITYAPTSESTSTGVGEGIAQGTIETIFGKYGKSMNKFLKFGFKVLGGTVGETIQEYSGQYLDELSKKGVNSNQAFNRTFGRDIEDGTDKLMITLITSALFSGVFNAKVFLESKTQLLKDYNEGKIPESKMIEVKELLDKAEKHEAEAKNEIELYVEKETPENEISVVEKKEVTVEDKPIKEEAPKEIELKKEEVVVEAKEVKEPEVEEAKQIDVYHGGEIKSSEGITSPLFVTSDQSEAQRYADGNDGNVLKTSIDENKLATEEEAREILKEIIPNYDKNDGMFHEFIDDRFPDYFIGKKKLQEFYDVMKKKGIKAIKFTDSGLNSRTSENIIILDPKELDNTSIIVGENNVPELLKDGYSPIINGKPVDGVTEEFMESFFEKTRQESVEMVKTSTKEKQIIDSEKPTTTLTYESTVKGKKKTTTYNKVDTENVLFKDKNGNTLHKHETGFIVLDAEGNPKSLNTSQNTVKKYQKTFDYDKGEKAKLEKGMDGNEAERTVSETSNNPRELAELIVRREQNKADIDQVSDSSKEGAIAQALSGKNLSPDSYMKNTGLKRKDIKSGIKLHHFKAGGMPLDMIAETAMENMAGNNQTGEVTTEITENDIVEFLEKYPNTSQDYFKEVAEDSVLETAKDRYRDITGFNPTNKHIAEVANKGEAITDSKEAILKDIKKIKKGESTSAIAKRAIDMGIIRDSKIQEALKPKIEANKKYQKEMNAEFGLDDDIELSDEDLPFQKASRKKIVGKKYVGDMIKALQKSMPGVKVEFDPSLDGIGAVRNGKVVINPNRVSSDTAIHEFSEIWVEILKNKNKLLYSVGEKLVKDNKELMDFVKANNPHLTTEAEIANEAMSVAIGEDGVEYFNSKQARSKLKVFLDKVAAEIRRFFGISKRLNYRDINNMTLKDFTRLSSKELLDGQPITTLSDAQVDGFMKGDFNIMEEVTVDSKILKDVSDNLIDKTKNFLRANFTSQRLLTKEVSNSISTTRSAINHYKNKAAKNIELFNELLRDHKKQNNLTTEQLETLLEDINSFLKGETTVNALQVDINSDLGLSITIMRNDIDLLSEQLLEQGLLTGDIVGVINENLGVYLRSTYKIHKQQNQTVKDYLKGVPEDVVRKARALIYSQLDKSKVTKIKFKTKEEGLFSVVLENQFGTESRAIEMTREDLIALMSTSSEARSVPNTFDFTNGELTLDKPVDPNVYGINFKDAEYVSKTIEGIISKNISNGVVFGTAGLNKKDISILKAKKEIPQEIKDLLGEIKDPAANYIETISKMSSLIEYNKFLMKLKNDFEGQLIWSEADAPPGTVKISKSENPKWQPIEDMYATEEFLNALNEFENDSLFQSNNKALDYTATILSVANTYTKSSLTKYNPGSNARNHIGAYMMSLRLGYANPIEFAEAYEDYWKGIKGTTDESFNHEEFDMMSRLGMIDDNVGFQIYNRSWKDALSRDNKLSKTIKKAKESKAGRIAGTPSKAIDEFYVAPDAAAKIFIFRKMKAEYKEVYSAKFKKEAEVEIAKNEAEKLKRNKSHQKISNKEFYDKVEALAEEKLNEHTANVVKDVMPTYSKLSKAAKILSKNPVVGAFASFATETVRNTYNQAVLGANEYKEGVETGNKKLKKMGRRKIKSLAIMSIALPAISTALRAFFGISDDDDSKFGDILPEWEKNSWRIPYAKQENGVMKYVDLSYTDPMSMFQKPIRALMMASANEDLDALDAAVLAFGEVKGQFLGKEPLFSALSEAYENRDRYGRHIAQPKKGNSAERFAKRVFHVADQTKPKFIETGMKLYDIIKGEEKETEFGESKDLTTFAIQNFAGTRFKQINLKITASRKISEDFKYSKEGAEAVEAKNIYSLSKIKSQEDLDEANLELLKVYNKHQRYLDAVRAAGGSEKDIRNILYQKRNGRSVMPKKYAIALLNYKPYTVDMKSIKLKKPRTKGKVNDGDGKNRLSKKKKVGRIILKK